MTPRSFSTLAMVGVFQLLLGGAMMTQTESPPTTKRPGCEYNGVWIEEGDQMTSPDGCEIAECMRGEISVMAYSCQDMSHCKGIVVHTDGQCCEVCQSTTTPPTTLPPNACLYNGKVYMNYETVLVSHDGCNITECHYGMIRNRSKNVCKDMSYCSGDGGVVVTIPGQCCKECRITTTIKTTTSPNDCLYEGKVYRNNERVYTSQDACYIEVCYNGKISATSIKCAYPSNCAGIVVKPKDECCPQCHSTTTPITTPSANACFYEGKVYRHSEVFLKSSDGCSGNLCDSGSVVSWTPTCADLTGCDGTVTSHPGYCCDVCMPPEGGCFVDGQVFRYNEMVNTTDPCRPCKCFPGGLVDCAMFNCPSTDCRNPYRYKGECCFTCGSSGIVASTLLVLLSVIALEIFRF